MKTIILLSLLAAMPLLFSAQTVLMEEYPGNDTVVPRWGKNLAHFIHPYFIYGIFADDFSNASAHAKIPGSSEFAMGLRYKRKITNFYAMGLDFRLNFSGVSIRQEDSKTFPMAGKHKKESIQTSGLSLEYFNRINFDRRGNKIGKYLDLGVYGFFNLNSYHFIRDESDTLGIGASKATEVKFYKPDYLNNYGYGVSCRLGSNALVFYARYRLSDMVKKTGNYVTFPELPRLQAGIELSVF